VLLLLLEELVVVLLDSVMMVPLGTWRVRMVLWSSSIDMSLYWLTPAIKQGRPGMGTCGTSVCAQS
jgi:hypothetical protein